MKGKAHMQAIKEAVAEHKANLRAVLISGRKAKKLIKTFPKNERELYQDQIDKQINSVDALISKLENE